MAEDRGERLVAQMRKTRGYLYPEWELVAQQDPGFMERYDGLYQEALGKDESLPIKSRELAEILGALEATIIPGGAPTFMAGVRALVRMDGNAQR